VQHQQQSSLTALSSTASTSTSSSSLSLSSSTGLNDDHQWLTLLAEFRGGKAKFRVDEFKDSLLYVLKSNNYDTNNLIEHIDNNINSIVKDVETNGTIPLCAYVKVPSYEIASQLTLRCTLLRSISEIWGEGVTLEEVDQKASSNFDTLIAPHFPHGRGQDIQEHHKQLNSWKVAFRRYGRGSNLDPAGKFQLLENFAPLLRSLNGKVDLHTPSHELLYLEDWYDYHEKKGKMKPKQNEDDDDDDDDSQDSANEYVPQRLFLGRIIQNGPKLMTTFDLKTRPYLGTTTMDAISSHVSAVAAMIGKGDIVLDPFAGTCSLLLACAYLGADVVGSDIDLDCLGLPYKDRPSLNYLNDPYVNTTELSKRSKNSNFKRNKGLSQEGLAPIDNFNYYGLRHHLKNLYGMDAKIWDSNDDDGDDDGDADYLPDIQDALKTYKEFDAIVTDPPFGRREKAMGVSKVSPMGHNDETITTLFNIASRRIKTRGRLVFWLPTEAFWTEDNVISLLESLLSKANSNAQKRLKRIRVREDMLHDRLWRWLCVYEVT